MKRQGHQGFTIIETMLFLAITGLLVMAVLVGSTSAIGRQRYKDSVNDLHSFFQEQYSSVLNTSNQREVAVQCNEHGIDETGAGAVGRGQTDCVLLGKLIRTDNVNANELKIVDIYGYSNSPDTTDLDDIEIFKSGGYDIKILGDSQKDYQINWGVKVFAMSGVNKKPFSLLVVRSPNNGNILTFFKEADIFNPQSLVASSNLKAGTICLNPEGLLPGDDKMAIKIDPRAAGSGGVSLINAEASLCP